MHKPIVETLLISATSWEMLVLRRSARLHGATLLRLGMGARRASANLDRALATHRPRLVLLAGFSGGVQENQHTGSIALPAVFSAAGRQQEYFAPCVEEVRPLLESHLKQNNIVLLKEVRQVSAPALVGPKEKSELGRRWPDACGVDMESYALAEICAHQKTPFLCVRVILDEVRQKIFSPKNLWRLPFWYSRAAFNLSLATQFILLLRRGGLKGYLRRARLYPCSFASRNKPRGQGRANYPFLFPLPPCGGG